MNCMSLESCLRGLQHSLTALPTSMAAVMNMHGGEGNTLHPFFTRPNGMFIFWSNIYRIPSDHKQFIIQHTMEAT